MSQKDQTPVFQRNALAPGILAAIVLFLAPVLFTLEWDMFVRYAVSILALIIAWFSGQAKQWWWIPVFVVIAVVWNPVSPLPLDEGLWNGIQPAAAVVFLAAGALIKSPRV
ncbi:DUF6804 family protein [uncultured Microbacterium sp.]|uniref:DUF6804 family protein n=1 Tax=uncultured Microbacterium sp. TaxID=191216 RepID=UPI0026324664|nr:DUF6804 family protein [uncultured Microbacterium sp.]